MSSGCSFSMSSCEGCGVWRGKGIHLGLSTLFARFIVACNSDLIVGFSDGSVDVEVIGSFDGFCFVERNFVGVCLMCPLEVIGEGFRCFCTAWYVMYGHVAKAPLSMAASHVDLTGKNKLHVSIG